MSRKRRERQPPETLTDLASYRGAYVTARQIADYWAVHVVTVQRWLREGELKGMRLKGGWRIRTDDARLYELRLFRPRVPRAVGAPDGRQDG